MYMAYKLGIATQVNELVPEVNGFFGYQVNIQNLFLGAAICWKCLL